MPELTVTPKYARTQPLQLVCPVSLTVTPSMPGLRASDTGHKALMPGVSDRRKEALKVAGCTNDEIARWCASGSRIIS